MNRKILLVDDSVSIRESVAFFLEQQGFEVKKAEDGEKALEYLTNYLPDLIITDLHMPNMNGIELIKKIRSTPPISKLPTILLTTETLKEKKLQAKKAGATGWINKPFEQERLLKVINKLVR